MRTRIILGGALAVAALGLALVARQASGVPARQVATALAADLSRALGRPVRFARAELQGFPWPAERIEGVQVGSDARPFLRVREIRSRLSLPALLAGKVALRSLELRGVELDLAERERAPAAAIPRVDAAAAQAAHRPLLLVTRVRVIDGALRRGDWRVEGVQADGQLHLDGSLSLHGSGDLVGLGRLRALDLELSNLGGGNDLRWDGHAEVDAVDLAGLRARLGVSASLFGRVSGRIDAAGRGARLRSASLDLSGANLDLRQHPLRIAGQATLAGSLPGQLTLDLGDAQLTVEGQLEKRRAAPLRLELRCSATGAADASACLAGSELALVSEPLRLRGQLAGEPALRASGWAGDLDLAALRPWWIGAPPVSSGRVRMAGGELDAAGRRSLALELERVELQLPRPAVPPEKGVAPQERAAAQGDDRSPMSAALSVSGALALDGAKLASPGLQLELRGQRVAALGSWDLAANRGSAQIEAQGVDLGVLSEVFVGSPVVQGTLSASGSFSGPATLADLRGTARVSIANGFVPGAALPWPPELRALRRDPAGRGESFRRILGAFSLDGSKARFQTLALDHDLASLELSGDVALADGELELAGQLILSSALDSSLGGAGRTQVLPIRRISGRLPAPKIEMDRERMRSVLAGYAAYLKSQEKLRAGQRSTGWNKGGRSGSDLAPRVGSFTSGMPR